MYTKIIISLVAILCVSQAVVIDLGVVTDDMPCVSNAANARDNSQQAGDCASAIILANARKRALAPVVDADYGHYSLCRSKDATNSNVFVFSTVANNDPTGKAAIACPSDGDLISFSVQLKAKYNVTGYVKNADTLNGIPGAFVYLVSDTSYNSTTAADGSYQLSMVPNGTYQITFSAAGYSSDTVNIVVNQNTDLDAPLSLTVTGGHGSIRVVTTWGPVSDLDTYLYLGACTLYYGSTSCACAGGVYEIDCTTGYGPETIIATDATACGVNAVYGVNRYYVPVESTVVVKLYTTAGLVGQWSRPSVDFAGAGLGWWRVFSLSSDSHGQLVVTTINAVAGSLV